MAETTDIEWTDATWNVITGCSVLSPGCTNCYAMRLAGTRLKHHPSREGLTIDTKAGPVWNGQVRFNEEWLTQPLQWRRPRNIFVCAHGDLFHDEVPDAWLDRVFAVMALAPHHQFQVLTKRAKRMRDYFRDPGAVALRVQDVVDNMEPDGVWKFPGHEPWVADSFPLANVWLGVSTEDQARADERIPHLLATPAAVRWLSVEPMLGPIDLTAVAGDIGVGLHSFDALRGRNVHHDDGDAWTAAGRLHWIVAGGESGPGARPMHPEWPRLLRDECAAAGVPFFFKQWGAWYPAYGGSGAAVDQRSIRALHVWGDPLQGKAQASYLIGKKASGHLLDGVEHRAVPA